MEDVRKTLQTIVETDWSVEGDAKSLLESLTSHYELPYGAIVRVSPRGLKLFESFTDDLETEPNLEAKSVTEPLSRIVSQQETVGEFDSSNLSLPFFPSLEIRALLGTPIDVDGHVAAALLIFGDDPVDEFSPMDLTVLETAAKIWGQARADVLTTDEGPTVEGSFQEIIDRIPTAIFATDSDDRFIFANEETGTLLGVAPEPLEGRSVGEFILKSTKLESLSREQPAEPNVELEEVIAEERFHDVSGGERVLRFRKMPFRASGGKVGTLSVASEMTDRQRVERESQLFQEAIEHIQDGLIIADADTGEIVDVNETACETLSRDRTWFLSRRLSDVDNYIEESVGGWDALLSHLKNDGPIDWESEYPAKDGASVGVKVHADYIEFRHSRRLIILFQDLTRRRRNQRKLERNELFLRELNKTVARQDLEIDERIQRVLELGCDRFETAFAFVTLIEDGEQHITHAVGEHSMLQQGASGPLSEAYCRKTIERDKPLRVSDAAAEGWKGDPAFEKFGLGCYIGSRLEVEGKLRGSVCFADSEPKTDTFSSRDSTAIELMTRWIQSALERQKSLERLKEARDEARDANRAKSKFVARMSHEIRTPLNAIMGIAELLQETSLDEQQRHYVDIFRDSSETLLHLINDILDLSKIEAGKLELRPAYFDLEGLFDELGNFFAQRAHSKGLELNIYVDPEMPPAVRGDASRVRQILINLVGNALKFTESGEVNLRAEVLDASTETMSLRVEVEDTGIGISEEDQRMIFEEFRQVDESSSRRHEGTGLGLSICKLLVEMMDGDIGLDSERGEGSKFWFEVELPYSESAGEVEEYSRRPSFDDVDFADVSILIVDDNETNREILEGYLENTEAATETVSRGQEAFERIEENEYDVVLLDKRMPDMDGFDLLDELPDDSVGQSIVMLSSDGLDTTQRRAEDFDLGGLFVKPLSRRQLIDAVASVVEGESPGQKRTKKRGEQRALTTPGQSMSLLLAEDNANNRLVVNAYLEDEAVNIEEAQNGEEALERMRNREYDIVLMDLEMPKLDGYEVMRQFRDWEASNRETHQHIVALTAHAMEGAEQKARDAGCDEYLAKPIDKERLLETIRDQVEQTKAASESTRRTYETFPFDQLDESLLAILPKFFENLSDQIEELEDYFEQQNPPEVERVAHGVKGSAGSFGFERLEGLAADVEETSGEECERLEQALDRLIERARRLNEEFEEWKQT